MSLHNLIEEYSEKYCSMLEAAYGQGMMSEGGTDAIELMFADTDMHDKLALDIGFGLGGVAFYLAENYHTHVTGIEINPWMVAETTKRTPKKIQHLTNFQLYQNTKVLNFADNSFDIVYSEGVLTHVQDKQELFNEVHRILKPEGQLIIVDWLSPMVGKWGELIQKMCEIENLTLYAETESNYIKLLQQAGFHSIEMNSENQAYMTYNRDIVKRLQQQDNKNYFCRTFGNDLWQNTIEGYKLIADAIESKELLIRLIRGGK